jgi:pantoate--beta-alanine ligase
MDVCRTIAAVRAATAAARAGGRRVGFVPTMGALHAGHLSLVQAARVDGCFVVASVFVNPTQFAPGEDFSRYPRDEAGDLRRLEQSGVDAAFVPSVEEMYPAGFATTIHVAGLGDHLCGPLRPGHFDGVATVVARLFGIVGPERAYFGKKDAQQLAIIRRMTADLGLPIEVIGCATVRAADGLAMSSRNAYLSPAERVQAASLQRALLAGRGLIGSGARECAAIESEMARVLREAGPVEIEYASVVDALSLQPSPRVPSHWLLAIAARIGRTRLIDNLSSND